MAHPAPQVSSETQVTRCPCKHEFLLTLEHVKEQRKSDAEVALQKRALHSFRSWIKPAESLSSRLSPMASQMYHVVSEQIFPQDLWERFFFLLLIGMTSNV